LKPADLVGVNKDSYLILDTLPAEYDSRVKAMEVDEKPTEDYSDIGGLDKQIQELREAVVLPMTHAEKFKTLGIRAPKGVLLYGPPGTGKTLIARACAAQTNAAYLKLAGPLLGADVHRRRRQVGARRVRPGERESSRDHLHRRD
jgi:26S proteasome regulatory subunit T5